MRKNQKNKEWAAKFRLDRKTELLRLATVLENERVCADVSPLKQAANDCAQNLRRRDDEWGYEMSDLQFEIATPRETEPSNIGKQLSVRVSVNFHGQCVNETYDPFSSLELNIEVFDAPPPACSSYVSWHFDRHIADDLSKDVEAHPLYHFQHGGHKINTNIANEIGRLLLLAPPRLPHPPMDGILAIDFILSNFSGHIWRSLRADSADYRALVVGAQMRLWRPYMALLGQIYETESFEEGAAFAIWPLLASERAKHNSLISKSKK
ncbi:hypothetical protein M0D68_14195 [Paraburkholderia sp. SEWSISQ10-3 4]|uniref:hypothetical protein n=1 Tax=Paraburkholderia TaxID=1822464 RepID=UPI00225A6481|nr:MULTISPECIES: hypothetical protein [Paraburkholderia]MCX4139341.1 hypothetical protein [Paraburkholderia aspalathi]MDN7172029.1 hypothetical protein [Paraburkholderia sp. SEWSISQ10-3 4]MDQ6501668.1 hypothetical protein [Paraburkholderia aspalathi]